MTSYSQTSAPHIDLAYYWGGFFFKANFIPLMHVVINLDDYQSWLFIRLISYSYILIIGLGQVTLNNLFIFL